MRERPEYGPIAKGLHWAVALLLLAQLLLGYLMPGIKRDALPGQAMNLHMSIGFVILAVSLLRLAWRLAIPVTPAPGQPAWQRVGGETVHWLLYGLVLVSVFTGWFYASMRGWDIRLFGALDLPALTAKGSPLGRSLGRLHENVVLILAIVAGLHIAAALAHFLLLRDGVLQRILPRGWLQRGATGKS